MLIVQSTYKTDVYDMPLQNLIDMTSTILPVDQCLAVWLERERLRLGTSAASLIDGQQRDPDAVLHSDGPRSRMLERAQQNIP